MTPRQVADRLRRDKAAVARLIEVEERKVAERALQRAVGLSSGLFSTAELRRLGHPYATRHGAPQLPPGVINAQRGLFRSRWRLIEVRKSLTPGQPGAFFVIENRDRAADFLQPGTRFMFRRPIDEAVEAWWQRERYNRVMAVLFKVGL